jgi:TolB-like protein/Flp pilus assembly protein TadD
MPPVRRLAAILAADVAGYSRLMGSDEEGTHKRLQAHLRELIEPKIAEHRGRIVKNTGDGFLAEFASVVDAVRCAIEMQRRMTERNAGTSPENRIEFRVGINLGDVIAEKHDIFGDGVNVAARLEALAEPGGICVSRVVRDQVRDKLDFAFEDMGAQEVKNIARPVRVYRVRDRVGELAGSTVPLAPAISPTSSVPRLSIVVLPFTNLSDDREQQYFADGITEDLTTDLSRIAHSLVISRNSAFTYRNKPIDTKQIGRELGVRYVLEGSVRRSGNQVRVTAQLVDAETDAHLWAERFDSETSDLFALQDLVTSRIAVELDLGLMEAEARRPIRRPDALDYIFRGRATTLRPYSRESAAEEISLFEQALALDPRSVETQSLLASALSSRVLAGWVNPTAADIARAEGLVGQALAASPRSAMAHSAKGQVLRAQRRFSGAIPEYETAIAFNRNWATAFYSLGQCKLFAGWINEVIPLEEQAIRLSPRDPWIYCFYEEIGLVHLLQSRIDEAIGWLEKARTANPEHPAPRIRLASAYGLKGEAERAAAELAEARRVVANDRYKSIARLKAVGNFGVPNISTLFEVSYFAGLRRAGMPEE